MKPINLIQYPKATIPYCVNQSGWYARIERREKRPDPGGSGISTPTDPPPEWIEKQIIDSLGYQPNDDAAIRALQAQFDAVYAANGCSSFIRYEGGGYGQPKAYTVYLCQSGQDAVNSLYQIAQKISLLTPGFIKYVVRRIVIRNPAYRAPEQRTEAERKNGIEIIALNNRFRATRWLWVPGSSSLSGQLRFNQLDYHEVVPIAWASLIVRVDFFFCGCGTGEINCKDCCVPCCSFASALMQKLSR